MTTPSTPAVPTYRYHKARDCAVVTLSGRDFYLGPYGSLDSKAKYERLIGEWLAAGRAVPPGTTDAGLTVNDVVLAYMTFAQGYYRDENGESTREIETMKLVFRPLKALHGNTPAPEFGPKALKAVRDQMIASGLARKTINQRIGYIKRMFAWACSEELLPPSVHHGLQSLAGLRRGRSGVRETRPVPPVPDAYVDAIEPFLPPTVRAMLQLQRLTGMRSGELVRLRACDLDMTGKVWRYLPARHKTAYLGYEKVVVLGPQCQAILKPFLTLVPTVPLFSPRQAEAERAAAMRMARQTPVQPSQLCRAKARPKREPGESYDTRSYYRALRYGMSAAEKAGVLARSHFWHPHQLRHNAAQRIQREAGLEAARAFLGHVKADMTAHYAGLDEGLASNVALRMA